MLSTIESFECVSYSVKSKKKKQFPGASGTNIVKNDKEARIIAGVFS